ncbi:4-hydroxybenzoate polyprenyltransferase [Rhodothermus profundi]|uniref:4-hydroxybenzoate polyprenyltransferase n=1 Tax=Rhodothermus profundi TaxID=633813 RepID=A0A1M6XVS7_9BACT|nr:4-hydroxybenzoate polyprenyltransferase [Rhodothermus profundi]
MHIPWVAAGLLAGNAALLQIPLSKPLLVLEATGAWVVYLLDRALNIGPEDLVNQPERVAWWRRQQKLLRGGLAIAGLLIGWAALHVQASTLVAGAGLGLIGLLYMLPGVRLKQWGIAKPILIAGTWSLGTTLLLPLEAGRALGANLWLLTGYRLLWILPNPLLADWPDRQGDRVAGIRTPAVRWNYKTLRNGALLLLLGALSIGLILIIRLGRAEAAIDLMGVLCSGMLIMASRAEPSEVQLIILDLLLCWPVFTMLALTLSRSL